MPDDAYLDKVKHMALLIHEQNRAEQIRFYKELAAMGKGEISEDALDGGFTGISDAQKHLEAHEGILGRIEDQDAFDAELGKLAIADFLIRRAKELREITEKKGDAGIHSLYISMRNRVAQLLREPYFGSSLDEALDGYLDTEPVVTACSELCGLPAPKLPDIVSNYQKRVVRGMGK